MTLSVPHPVRRHVRRVFSTVNDKVTERISTCPNTPEESLDISFIEHLSSFAGPVVVSKGWAVRIAAHFIGNIRHYRRYEIADIGVVVVLKQGLSVVSRKLALLQSKRLYPTNHDVVELDNFDYELGLALVTRSDAKERTLFSKVVYEFNEMSAYGAMKAGSNQCKAIQNHFGETNIPVHYMMYNPVTIPWSFSYPSVGTATDLPGRTFGIRVLEGTVVHELLGNFSAGRSPRLSDFLGEKSGKDNSFGWSLEDFFDEVIQCREGYLFDGEKDDGIRSLFRRKSGPIFAVVEITIENSS